MPDLFSLALGGGSIVSPDPPAVGPHSVGYRLAEAALVFGGRTITATDCAVAAGIAEIGDNALAKVPPAVAAAVLDRARAMIEDAVDRMVSSALAGDRDERRSKDRRLTHHQHKTSG